MDAFSAGQLSRTLDKLHSTIYFAPEAGEMYTTLGLDNQRAVFREPVGAHEGLCCCGSK